MDPISGFLVTIPGPEFLVYYIILSAACGLIAWFLVRNADKSEESYSLDEKQLTPSLLACMRGGKNEIMRVALFSLLNKKKIEVSEKSGFMGIGKKTSIIALPSKEPISDPAEKALYEFIGKGRDPRDIFKDSALSSKFDSEIALPLYHKLENMRFIKNAEERAASMRALCIAAIPLLIIGVWKLVLGAGRGKPIAYLLILLIFVPIVMYGITSPKAGSTTRLGKKVLKDLSAKFLWARDGLSASAKLDGVDPVFVVSIYGVGILSSIAAYSMFAKTFRQAGAGGCGGGAGCGGGGCGGCGG